MGMLVIESGARVFRGVGEFTVSTRLFRLDPGGIERPLVPYISGHVVFDSKTTNADLMSVTDGLATCTKDGQRPIVFVGATVMSADPSTHANGYTIRISGTPLPN